jgi:hypothetical protein
MHEITFNFSTVASGLSILGAVILLITARKFDSSRWAQRIALTLLCIGLVVSGVSHLFGSHGETAALVTGLYAGFILSAFIVLLHRRPT